MLLLLLLYLVTMVRPLMTIIIKMTEAEREELYAKLAETIEMELASVRER
jgi:hypothetical protein